MGTVAVTVAEPAAPGARAARATIHPVVLAAGGLVCAVVIAIVLAYNVGNTRQQARSNSQSAAICAHLQGLAGQLATLELLAATSSDAQAGATLTEVRSEIASSMGSLRDLDGGPPSAAIASALTILEDNTLEVNRLATAGNTNGALELYQAQVLPAYTEYISSLTKASSTYHEAAARSTVAAGLGALGTTLLAAVAMGLLTWLFERARQSARWQAAKEREQELRQSEERFRSLVQNTADIIMVLDAEGNITFASPSIERILGYSGGELIGRPLSTLLHSDEHEKVQRMLEEASRKPGKSISAEFRAQHSLGYWLFLDALGNNLLDNPSVKGILLTARDISERWMLEEQLAHQAFHDSLTRLPNRALFMDRLSHALVRAGRSGSITAVLFLDLNDFKVINDTLGHRIGDELLTAVGHRIVESVRDSDTVARLGGDEFTVLLEDLPTPGDATVTAERIVERLRAPFTLNGQKAFISASIGIAISDSPLLRPDDLLRHADVAMYDAKHGRKANHAVYEPSMNQSAWKRLELEVELREALELEQLLVYYQPIFDLESCSMVEVEALIRWQHPTRGLISPAEFIPVAEETGLIVPIGNWVLRESCRQVRAWQRQIPRDRPLTLSANLSARQFQDANLVDDIRGALLDSGLDPSTLKLEITESVALDNTGGTLDTLNALKGLGLRLAIDDFGTGYSALSYLKHYPIDTLKIDRSFVSGLGSDLGDTGIVNAVIAFSRTLGLQVTAEGIETAEQLEQLRDLGCDLGQGYYFSKPRGAAETRRMLQLRSAVAAASQAAGGEAPQLVRRTA